MVSDSFPFLLNSGRDLYHLNAATMTGRTENSRLRPTDTLDILPSDARRLGLEEGESVRIVSRFGEAVLPVRFDRGLRPGEVFATFHSPKVFLNKTTTLFETGSRALRIQAHSREDRKAAVDCAQAERTPVRRRLPMARYLS